LGVDIAWSSHSCTAVVVSVVHESLLDALAISLAAEDGRTAEALFD
jgi:hypothetical protein